MPDRPHPENQKNAIQDVLLAGAVGAVLCVPASRAVELKLLTAGAFKSTVVALLPEYEKASGNKVTVENDTVGALMRAARVSTWW